jgi:hypothetical protein
MVGQNRKKKMAVVAALTPLHSDLFQSGNGFRQADQRHSHHYHGKGGGNQTAAGYRDDGIGGRL